MYNFLTKEQYQRFSVFVQEFFHDMHYHEYCDTRQDFVDYEDENGIMSRDTFVERINIRRQTK